MPVFRKTFLLLVLSISFLLSHGQDLGEIVCPQDKEIVNNGELLIVFDLNPELKIKRSSIKVFLEGIDMNPLIKINQNRISLLITQRMRPDRYNIEIQAKDEMSQGYTKKWSFQIANNTADKFDFGISQENNDKSKFTGLLEVGSRLTNISGSLSDLRQEPDKINTLNFKGSLHYKSFKVPMQLYLTNQENEYVQARNRYLIGIEHKIFSIKYGDDYPNFDRLALSGSRIRGWHTSLSYRGAQFSFIKGYLNRELEGSLGYYDINSGFPPPGLLNDSTYIVSGKYARKVTAINATFSSIEKSKFYITFIKSTDDTNSIDYGGAAGQNVVLSARNTLNTKYNRFIFDIGGAVSMTTNDIRKGVTTKAEFEEILNTQIPFYPENLEKLIIINTTTEPMTWKNKPSGSLFITTKANIWGQKLKLNFTRLGSSYESFANPYQINDRRKFSMEDRVSLFNKKLSALLNYKHVVNNLSQIQSLTKTTQSGGVNFSLLLGKNKPRIIGMYRLHNRIENFADTNIRYQTTNINNLTVGMNYNFKTGAFGHSVNIMYNNYIRDNSLAENSATSSNVINFNISETFPFNLDFSGYYNSFVVTNDTADLNIQYAYGGRLGYFTQNKKLRFSIGYRGIDAPATDFVAASIRKMFDVELSYLLYKDLRLSVQAGNSQFREKLDTSRSYKEFWGMFRLYYKF